MKYNNKSIFFIFAGFFFVFIVVDISYIYIAQKTWRGVSTEDSYRKGLKYNQTIAAVEEQKKLDWDLQLEYKSFGQKTGELQVILLDNNKPITDANLIVNIKRPVQEGQDFSINLKFNSITQKYQSFIKFPLIGQWDLEIVVVRGGDVLQKVVRLIINY